MYTDGVSIHLTVHTVYIRYTQLCIPTAFRFIFLTVHTVYTVCTVMYTDGVLIHLAVHTVYIRYIRYIRYTQYTVYNVYTHSNKSKLLPGSIEVGICALGYLSHCCHTAVTPLSHCFRGSVTGSFDKMRGRLIVRYLSVTLSHCHAALYPYIFKTYIYIHMDILDIKISNIGALVV